MKQVTQQLLIEGISAHKKGNLQEAEKVYRSILQEHPNHPDANHNLGLVAVSVNKTELALPLLKIAVEQFPNIEQFWLSYIDALLRLEKYDEVKKAILQGKKNGLTIAKAVTFENNLNQKILVKKNKSKAPCQQQLDKLLDLFESNQFEEAEQLALLLTSQFPEHQFGWKLLGVLLGDKDKQAALEANQKAVGLSPFDAEAYVNLSITLKELGRLEDAEINCRKAIEINPEFAEGYHNLGIILRDINRIDEAESSLRQAINYKFDFAEAHNMLGNIYKNQGKLEEAEASCKKAITIKPDYAEAYNDLGNILLELGKLHDAEANYKIALNLKPDFKLTMMNLSLILDYLNKSKRKNIYLNKLIDMDPKNYGLRAAVQLAISKFLERDKDDLKKILTLSSEIGKKTDFEYKNEKVYHQYLRSILDWNEKYIKKEICPLNKEKLYIIGDSHSLVYNGLNLKKSSISYFCQSFLIQGCKQWHLGNQLNNKYKYKYENIIKSLPQSSSTLLVFGEIDCRLNTGIIKHYNKYPNIVLDDLIKTTSENFLSYIYKINLNYRHRIIIQAIPSPNADYKNVQLTDVIAKFNKNLRKKSYELGFSFIDVYSLTNRGDGFSNNKWHIDQIHLTPEGVSKAWNKCYLESKCV